MKTMLNEDIYFLATKLTEAFKEDINLPVKD